MPGYDFEHDDSFVEDYHRAQQLQDEARWEESAELYESLAQCFEPHYGVLYGLGYARMRLGQYRTALHCLQQSVELHPNHPSTYYVMGYAHTELKEWEEAVPCYKRFHELNGPDYGARFYLGEALYELGRYDEAVPVLEESLRLKPGYLLAQMKLSKAYTEIGWQEEAYRLSERTTKGLLKHLYEHRIKPLFRGGHEANGNRCSNPERHRDQSR